MCSESQTVQDYVDAGVLEIGDGYRAKNTELGKKGLPFARAGNIDGGFNFKDADRFPAENIGRLGSKVSLPGDSLFTSKGTVGRIAYVTEHTPPFVYSPQLCYWRSRDPAAIDSRFLNVWMRGSEFAAQVAYLKGQTDMADYVSLRDQRRMSITLPPITEQRRIADVVFALDEKITANQQLSATLEEISRTVFQSWFVDFLPIRAKATAHAEGRDPLRAAMCALSGKDEAALDSMPREQYRRLTAITALFPDELIDSEFGSVPHGWEISTIGEQVTVKGGSTPSTREPRYWGGNNPWVTPKDLSGVHEAVLLRSERHITQAGVAQISSGVLPVGTVLLSSRAPIGYLALAMISVSINQGFIAMVCDKALPSTYVLHWVRFNMDAIKQRAGGTTFAEISKSAFKPMPVLVPDQPVLSAYETFARPIYQAIALRVAESHRLAELRDTLLPRLLSGEIRVGEAQELVEAAA